MREFKDIKALTDEETCLIRSTFPLNAFGGTVLEYRDGMFGVDFYHTENREGAWTHFHWGLAQKLYFAYVNGGILWSKGNPYSDGVIEQVSDFEHLMAGLRFMYLPETDEPNGARYWSVESWSRHGDDSQIHQTYKGALKTFHNMAYHLSDELPEDSILRGKSEEEIEALPYEDIVNAFQDAGDVGLMITAERFYDAKGD